MAEYEPFPSGVEMPDSGRSVAKRLVGCVGCGGLGVLGTFVALTLLVGGMSTGTSGCDIDFGPGEGKQSLRLPVEVSPRTGLADGATVRVTSSAFEADDVVGVAVCLRKADTQAAGVDACDENQGARYATDERGDLDATYAVPRVITVGGTAYDCAAKARRCLVVAADASEYDVSGGQTITFQTGLPAPDLTLVTSRAVSDHLPVGATPSTDGPVAAGTELTLLASGFQPDEPLLIAYCTDEVEEEGVIGTCDPEDADLALTAIMDRSVDGDFPRADASGAFTTTLVARETITPYGGSLTAAIEAAADTTTTSGPTGSTTTRPGGSSTTTQAGGTTTTTTAPSGEIRCTAAEGGCTIVIAAAADTKRSAILPYVVSG